MKAFDETPSPLGDEPGEDTPDLEALAERLRLCGERYREAHRLLQHHHDEDERLTRLTFDIQQEAGTLNRGLITAIVRAAGAVPPERPEDWRGDPSPVATATIAGRLYVVARTHDSDPPNTFEQIPDSCTLVVIEPEGSPL